MLRTCPDCSIALIKQNFHGVEIDVCNKCAGIFFDEGEVNQIRKSGSNSFEELDAKVHIEDAPQTFEEHLDRKCPNCQVVMSQYRYLYSSPIMLDSCNHCGGIWIENGELKAMAEYVRTCEQETAATVTAQIKSASIHEVSRAKSIERAIRYFSRLGSRA